MRVLWRQERERFLGALDRLTRHRERRRAAMMVLYDTGCRVTELSEMNLEDYDPQRKSLILINCKAEGHPRREVAIHSRTARALNAWIRLRPTSISNAMFLSQKGQRLSVRQLQDDYTTVCKLANIEPTGIHTLRHTSATRILDDRVLPIHQLSRRLGHRSTVTTYRYYVHGSVEEEALAINRSRL